MDKHKTHSDNGLTEMVKILVTDITLQVNCIRSTTEQLTDSICLDRKSEVYLQEIEIGQSVEQISG